MPIGYVPLVVPPCFRSLSLSQLCHFLRFNPPETAIGSRSSQSSLTWMTSLLPWPILFCLQCLKGCLNEREGLFAFLFWAFLLFVNLLSLVFVYVLFLCDSFKLSSRSLSVFIYFCSIAYCFEIHLWHLLPRLWGKTGQGSMTRDVHVATPRDLWCIRHTGLEVSVPFVCFAC